MKEVTYACLHAPIFIPGAGEYGRTLTNGLTGKARDLKMELTENGLFLKISTKGVQVLVPMTMVTHLVVA